MQNEFPPYAVMIENLFKKDPKPGVMLHHAATGLAGEIGELRGATTRLNFIEELGDIRFYFGAFSTVMKPVAEQIKETFEVVGSSYNKPSLGNVLNNLSVISCEILDLTKKSWVYEDRTPKEYEIWQQLALLQMNLDFLVHLFGLTWTEIEHDNQVKLLKGRYKTGTYSNEQAIARADKA